MAACGLQKPLAHAASQSMSVLEDGWVTVGFGGLDGSANCGWCLHFEFGSVFPPLFVVYAL